MTLLAPMAFPERDRVEFRVDRQGSELVRVRVPADVARAGLEPGAVDLVCALLRDSIPVYTGESG